MTPPYWVEPLLSFIYGLFILDTILLFSIIINDSTNIVCEDQKISDICFSISDLLNCVCDISNMKLFACRFFLNDPPKMVHRSTQMVSDRRQAVKPKTMWKMETEAYLNQYGKKIKKYADADAQAQRLEVGSSGTLNARTPSAEGMTSNDVPQVSNAKLPSTTSETAAGLTPNEKLSQNQVNVNPREAKLQEANNNVPFT